MLLQCGNTCTPTSTGKVCSTTGLLYDDECDLTCDNETLLTACLSGESDADCLSRCGILKCKTGCTITPSTLKACSTQIALFDSICDLNCENKTLLLQCNSAEIDASCLSRCTNTNCLNNCTISTNKVCSTA